MENYETYKQAIAEAEKAEGTAARKMEAYNESVAYSINQLSAAWEGFTQKLEASGSVKLFFNGLTAIIENLDHFLQFLMPLITTFAADKIVSLAKFLSPLVTTAPKSLVGFVSDRKAGKKVKVGDSFYENMTQKMTAENTNAIEGLTNAIRDNTAALRGEKPKSGSSGTVGMNTNSNTKTKKIRPGSVQDLQNQIDIGEQGVQGFKELGLDEDSEQIKKIRTRQEELKKQILKKQERSARLKTGVASGLGAAATRLATGGSTVLDRLSAFGWLKDTSDVEISGGETAAVAGIQGVLTGALTAWLGPFGTVLGTVFGDIGLKLWKNFAHADEINRKERAKQAKENLETIKGISSSVTGLIDLQSKIWVNGSADTSLWDADDWKQANKYVESLEKTRNASDGFKDALNKAETDLGDLSFTVENLIRNQEKLAKVEAARIIYEAEQTYAAGEQDRYTLLKEIEEAQKTLVSSRSSEEEKESARSKITANKAEIQEYTDALNEAYMKSAFYSSGISSMSEGEKNVASLDRLLIEMAEAAEEAAKDTTGEKFFEDDGTLKSEYRSSLIQDLRERGGYEAVLTESEKSISDYSEAMEIANDYTKETGKSFSELKDIVSKKGAFENIKKILNERGLSNTKEEIEAIIDAINSADENKIATIANSFNMTAEQFAKANENGDFNFVTTGMALENLDTFTERVNTLSDALAELAANGKLSSDSLKNIIQNYPFLLQGNDNSFGAGNILENLANLYAQGADSSIAQLLSGKFQSEATTSETWWEAWTQSEIGKEFVKKDSTYTTFKSFAEAMGKMSDDEKQSYIDYVSSLYETDFMEDVREKLVEWQTKAYENEISNLESIRDSLDDVNKQREKELELIKAKEALENAYAEKKRVYRAGVGFVYSTDQEAVKTAQEKVDELERQKDKDTIQYQIDSLQQQKEILESIEENERLKNLEEYVKSISSALGENGSLFNSILGQSSESFMTSMTEAIASGIEERAQKVEDQKNKGATIDAAIDLSKAGKELASFIQENMSILYDPYNPAYNDVVEEYKKKSEDVSNKAEKYESAKSKYNLDDFEMEENNLNKSWLASLAKRDPTSEFGEAQTDKILQNAGLNLSSLNAEVDSSINNKDSDEDFYRLLYYDNGDWKIKGSYKDFESAKNNMGKYEIVVLDYSDTLFFDRAVFKDKNGIIRWANADNGKIRANQFQWGSFKNPDAKAIGDISFHGGPALINENGLESIITPQGTITSLPSKTGIIPADLTRNLWALGEVAPNLIARLGGNNLYTNSNVSSTDNSININNLDAKFYTEEGFNGEAFLRDLKNQVILTANNH